ncbi:hypothetical protein ALC56_12684 [Trachymyrmex septentrionalis]|uniref:Uncharacterized protein n=1 Tax=Trachymyrmex septentrionalis TaxID=34720 RepID=A0A195EXN8_9HYME|nr:hypothetical protein ALC56_12684 [Trachymyrmex septentrionalis]
MLPGTCPRFNQRSVLQLV